MHTQLVAYNAYYLITANDMSEREREGGRELSFNFPKPCITQQTPVFFTENAWPPALPYTDFILVYLPRSVLGIFNSLLYFYSFETHPYELLVLTQI